MEQGPEGAHLMKFDVYDGYMPDREILEMPKRAQKEMEALHALLGQDPAAALPRVEKLIAAHPHVCTLQNWKHACLRHLGRKEEAHALAEKLFQSRPEYVFSRTMHAENLLELGDVATAREVLLDGKLHMQQIYPTRTRFHITEVNHWFYVLGLLHVAEGDRKAATRIRDLLYKLDPTSAAVAELSGKILLSMDLTGIIARMKELAGATGDGKGLTPDHDQTE